MTEYCVRPNKCNHCGNDNNQKLRCVTMGAMTVLYCKECDKNIWSKCTDSDDVSYARIGKLSKKENTRE